METTKVLSLASISVALVACGPSKASLLERAVARSPADLAGAPPEEALERYAGLILIARQFDLPTGPVEPLAAGPAEAVAAGIPAEVAPASLLLAIRALELVATVVAPSHPTHGRLEQLKERGRKLHLERARALGRHGAAAALHYRVAETLGWKPDQAGQAALRPRRHGVTLEPDADTCADEARDIVAALAPAMSQQALIHAVTGRLSVTTCRLSTKEAQDVEETYTYEALVPKERIATVQVSDGCSQYMTLVEEVCAAERNGWCVSWRKVERKVGYQCIPVMGERLVTELVPDGCK